MQCSRDVAGAGGITPTVTLMHGLRSSPWYRMSAENRCALRVISSTSEEVTRTTTDVMQDKQITQPLSPHPPATQHGGSPNQCRAPFSHPSTMDHPITGVHLSPPPQHDSLLFNAIHFHSRLFVRLVFPLVYTSHHQWHHANCHQI